jgi:hypothetical protein
MITDKDNLDEAVSILAQRAIPDLTEQLQNSATTAGWPEEIVDSLSIRFDGENLRVHYPEKLANQIEDLEYGKIFGLPNPAIRPFISRSKAYIESVTAEAFLEDFASQLEGIL